MQADATGRFCQSCQKSVIDFTSKSDNQIKEFLKDKRGEQLCGRFHVHQVKRIRIEIDPNLLISGIPFWQKFLVVFLVCFGQDFLGVDFVYAQTEIDSIAFKTEQVDSTDSLPIIQIDSTLEVAVDSIIAPPQFKPDNVELIYDGPFPMISGIFRVGDEGYYPECKIPFPFVKNQPKDATLNEIGIARTSQNNPLAPKHPRKKPSPPENAVIVDSGERRKTRRS
nr:hypothetical protein [uncultured Fluviicola sp.]